MISCSPPIKNSQQCQYYLDMTQSDYYANRYEQAGYWAGKGAELLGLSGPVRAKELQNLFDGFSPDRKTKLVQNAGSPDRQKALDFVPAPPKSVSVIWAMSPPEERATIERIHDEAVQAVADFFQENAAFTRRGKGGTKVEQVSLVLACFTHCTSRALDMQLHTHMLILNIGIRSDGTTGALHNHEFFELRKQADMIYLTHLALGLRLELGLTLEAEGQSFRIVGVPKEVCDFFSKRHAEVQEYMKVHGLEGPVAANLAALETRPKKQHVALEELFENWHRIGNSLGWGPEQARKLSRDKKILEIMSRLIEPGASKPYEGPGAQIQKWLTHNLSEEKAQAQNESRNAEGPGSHQSQSTSEESEARSTSWSRDHSRKPEPKTFKQLSKNRCVLKHRRWGTILWKLNLGVVELRIQRKRLQRKAPGWNPASKLELPAIRIVPWKIKLFDRVAPHERPQPKVLWKKSFLFAELRFQRQQAFPNTPAWSPGQKITMPRLSLGLKSKEPRKSKRTEESKQNKSHGMGHSH